MRVKLQVPLVGVSENHNRDNRRETIFRELLGNSKFNENIGIQIHEVPNFPKWQNNDIKNPH